MHKVFLILSLLLTGCSIKHVKFEPTGSACMDAALANFEYAKCSSISEQGELGREVKFFCTSPKRYNSWTTREYYLIIRQLGGTVPEGSTPLCADQDVILFYKDGIEIN